LPFSHLHLIKLLNINYLTASDQLGRTNIETLMGNALATEFMPILIFQFLDQKEKVFSLPVSGKYVL
jgi:hypothetical protein